MYKDVLRSIDDASLFPVIAIGIFFVFFMVLLFRVIKMDKKRVNNLASIPLEQEIVASRISPQPSNN
ncbi:MAG: hypothetical protein AAF399_05340 [Bacteroidota bacterium]